MLLGMNYLKKKLAVKRPKIEKRYKYYNSKATPQNFSGLNEDLKQIFLKSGWCEIAVDAIANRINFREFENDKFNMNEIFQDGNQDVFVDDAILGALISGCDFIHITKENGKPRLEVINGKNATGILDRSTNLLKEGYAILELDKNGHPAVEAYFTPSKTYYYKKGEKEAKIVDNPAPYPLLVPIIHKPDSSHPFGRSRIKDSEMETVNGFLRTLQRLEVSSEYYSFPQKYALGTSQDAEALDTYRSSVSRMLEITKDDDGDKPVVGQFTQQSMAPYIDAIKAYASIFAGESGLTTDDLGFKTENPAGSESIKASHANLNLYAEKSIKSLGVCLKNVGYIAACVRDNKAYDRHVIYKTIPKFEPVFRPDASAMGLIGDGAIKLNTAVPGFMNRENLRDLTGIESKDNQVDIFQGVNLKNNEGE